MNHITRPRKIAQTLSTQQVGKELLVYDESRHKAFCLNATSAAIWKRCDGVNTVRQIAAATTLELAAPITEDIVLMAVTDLQTDGLVEAPVTPAIAVPLSRRQMVQRLGAGAAMMLPVVATVMAPKAAQAYSGCFDCNVAKPTVNRDLAPPTSSPSGDSGSPTIFKP